MSEEALEAQRRLDGWRHVLSGYSSQYAQRPIPPTREYQRAMAAWCRYYVDTEAHDLGVCFHRVDRHGEATPVTPEERRLSLEYARAAGRRRDEELARAGATVETSRSARDRVCGWTDATQRRFLAELG